MAMTKRIAGILALSGFALWAWAQPPLDAKAYQEQEKRWQSCPDGWYNGPRSGRRNYSHDRYLWVVTPEFARRFCMPEHMIDPELKGAEAIAFKRVPSEDGHDRCVVENGQPRCSEDNVARFEIYLKSDLKLPAAQPEVRFYEGRRDLSAMHLSRRNVISMCPEYERGNYKPDAGKVPRFSRFCGHPDPGYGFALTGVQRNGKEWGLASLWEVGWRAEVIPGIDLLVLEGRGMAGVFEDAARAPAGVGRFAIVMEDKGKPSKCPWSDCKLVSSEFDHVIYLPERFMTQVKASLEATGGWKDFIRMFRQP